MTKTEREDMASLVSRIPCELSISTFDKNSGGSSWLSCQECSRCVLLRYLATDMDFLRGALHNELLNRPLNGGYEGARKV